MSVDCGFCDVTISYRAYDIDGNERARGRFPADVTRVVLDTETMTTGPRPVVAPDPVGRDYRPTIRALMAKLDSQSTWPTGTAPLERTYILRRALSTLPKHERRGAGPHLRTALTLLERDQREPVTAAPIREGDSVPRHYYYRLDVPESPPGT